MIRPAKEPHEATLIQLGRRGNTHATTPTRHAALSRERASCGTALTRARQQSPRPPNAATHAASTAIAGGSNFPKLGSPRRNQTSPEPARKPEIATVRPKRATSLAPAEPNPAANADTSNARNEPATPPERRAPLALLLRGGGRTSARHTHPASLRETDNHSNDNPGLSVRCTDARSRQRSEQSTPATSKPCLEPPMPSEL